MSDESGPQRQSTIDAIWARAKTLHAFAKQSMRQANQLESLAIQLQEIKKQAATMSVDGGDGGYCIGDGSDADEALYKLVIECSLERMPGS